MDVDLIELLAGLGLPSAIVAMVIIAFLFKDKFSRLTQLALVIAIGLAGVLGIVQIVTWITGKDVQVVCQPADFYAISPAGEPMALSINVEKSGRTIAKKAQPALDPNSFAARVLTLDATAPEKFAVKYNAFQQGTLNYADLEDNGWRKASDIDTADARPKYWFTHKVYVGQTAQLGKAGVSGSLELHFLAIRDDQAIVKLALKGSGAPVPAEVGVENKKVGAQDFPDEPTFYIAVREANFKEAWAAFSIFQYRGY